MAKQHTPPRICMKGILLGSHRHSNLQMIHISSQYVHYYVKAYVPKSVCRSQLQCGVANAAAGCIDVKHCSAWGMSLEGLGLKE